MSILLTSESGWIISHLKFFEKIRVTGSSPNDEEDSSAHSYLSLNPDLFEITEPFKDKVRVNGKRVKNCSDIALCETTKIVKALSDAILNDAQTKGIFDKDAHVDDYHNSEDNCAKFSPKDCEENGKLNERLRASSWPKNNFKAVGTCQQFFDTVKSVELPHFRGENPVPDSAVLSTVAKSDESASSHRYLFPTETKFYCNDVMNMETLFQENNEMEFDLIVMDPPWWNKFIRRRKRKQHEAGYEMLDDNGIAKLPINKVLNEDGIVVVWCTNAKSHQDKLINEIFPRWGVSHQGTFYWLKVTKSGVPICPFNAETKKQPYETILIGRKEGKCTNSSLESSSVSSPVTNKSKVVISIPSSINSHKPPLVDILTQMYPDKMFHRKLEIFARYLVPGFVSYGNEVVKLQHESLYIKSQH